MAAIDKIWLNKKDALEAIDWLGGLGDRFKETFKNSKYIPIDYIRYTREEINNIPDNEDIPLLCLPKILDKWLYQQPDCPSGIKNCLIGFNYCGDEDTLLEEIKETQPIYPKTKIKNLRSPKYNSPIRGRYYIDVYDPNGEPLWGYEMNNGNIIWTSLGGLTADMVGDYKRCASGAIIECDSWKALIRRIRKWSLQSGSIISGTDLGGDRWKLKIK